MAQVEYVDLAKVAQYQAQSDYLLSEQTSFLQSMPTATAEGFDGIERSHLRDLDDAPSGLPSRSARQSLRRLGVRHGS